MFLLLAKVPWMYRSGGVGEEEIPDDANAGIYLFLPVNTRASLLTEFGIPQPFLQGAESLIKV